MGFLSRDKVEAMGFARVGKNVKISDKASFYNPSNISIGDNTRIDDFCILSAGQGGIQVGSYIHIGCYSSFLGNAPIILHDFCGISGRVSFYSHIDDTSGEYLVQPTFPDEYRHMISGPIVIERHGLVGAGSIVFPGVTVGTGTLVAALSLVKESCEPYWIYGGVPAKKIKPRKRHFLELEKKFLEQMSKETNHGDM
jgi:galactoside O-acetyltransferase